LTVTYRDFRYIVPFLVQLGLFISPIAFSTSQVPESWRTVYGLNPLVGIIDGFRWSILGGRTPIDSASILTTIAVTAASLVLGMWYFRRMERGFADVI
jgi:lipopolysaccharide transport system permease protein